MLGVSFTGYNNKAGDLLTLRMRKQGSEATRIGTCKLHDALEYDAILQINDTGVTILV